MSAPSSPSAPAPAGEKRVDVSGLHVRLVNTNVDVVSDVSFQVAPGEILGLVGESGSGKTTVALALLGHTRRGLEVGSGMVMLGEVDVLHTTGERLRRMRGAEVAYVPQDPTSALNPALKIETQLAEVLRAHPNEAREHGGSRARIREALEEVGLGGVPHLLKDYPHQLSGGQQQRVVLAMAFLLRPRVIVLDEPTTGLDVTTQRRVLDTVRNLCQSYRVAAVYVSHDLAVVGGLVDTLIVLYAGTVMEQGSTAEVFGSPAHPYTRGLLQAIPVLEESRALEGIPGQPPRPSHRPPGCQFAPRCQLAIPACTEGPIPLVPLQGAQFARCIRTDTTTHAERGAAPKTVKEGRSAGDDVLHVSGLAARYGQKEVLSDVSMSLRRNECIAVVGESGSGKTTFARCLVGLHSSWSGEVRVDGVPVARAARHRSTPVLRKVQYIFQNPYTALNPRKTIGRIVDQPLLRFFPSLSRAEREGRVSKVLSDVALGPDFWPRYPDQLSGGERQRVAIARALIVDPDLLVCDEITSALDVSVQATIVELLRRLQEERELSLIFITHNLALVRSIAQQVVVLSNGEVVESGPVSKIFERPEHPYTIQLMEDAPTLSSAERNARSL